MEIRTLLGKRVAIVYVDELAADRRFVFLNGTAYARLCAANGLPGNSFGLEENENRHFRKGLETLIMRHLTGVDGLSSDRGMVEADFPGSYWRGVGVKMAAATLLQPLIWYPV